MKKEKTIAEIEQEIKVLEECVRLGEQIRNEGLVLKQTGKSRFSVSRDYDKLSENTKLRRLVR